MFRIIVTVVALVQTLILVQGCPVGKRFLYANQKVVFCDTASCPSSSGVTCETYAVFNWRICCYDPSTYSNPENPSATGNGGSVVTSRPIVTQRPRPIVTQPATQRPQTNPPVVATCQNGPSIGPCINGVSCPNGFVCQNTICCPTGILTTARPTQPPQPGTTVPQGDPPRICDCSNVPSTYQFPDAMGQFIQSQIQCNAGSCQVSTGVIQQGLSQNLIPNLAAGTQVVPACAYVQLNSSGTSFTTCYFHTIGQPTVQCTSTSKLCKCGADTCNNNEAVCSLSCPNSPAPTPAPVPPTSTNSTGPGSSTCIGDCINDILCPPTYTCINVARNPAKQCCT